MGQPSLSWVFLARAGSEHDLVDELGPTFLPEVVGEGLVASAGRPQDPDRGVADPAFARQAQRLTGPPLELHPEILADHAARALRVGRGGWPRWTLQVVAPDSADPHDPRRKAVDALALPLLEALRARLPEEGRRAEVEPADAAVFLQVWALDADRAVLGLTRADDVISRAPGGKVRLKRPADAPSRAGLKLEEAIGWIGVGPEKGDLCVDLGAAPGGWSQVATRRGAVVIAVDPARIKITLPPRSFTHVQENAFTFAPAETLDWVLCDMAWRPLEVAALLAKWGRRGWARQMIANFKLPMKRKAQILGQLLTTLAEAGWRGLRARQLYFDRDEVTVFGWLDASLARKGARAPFRLKAHEGKSAAEIERRRQLKADEETRPPRARGRGRGRPRGRARGRGRSRGRR